MAIESKSGGVGFVGLLTLVFVVAKLTGHLDWSWWWVFSPVLISAAFGLFILSVVGVIFTIALVLKDRE